MPFLLRGVRGFSCSDSRIPGGDLLIPQTVDGIEAGGAEGRIEAEEDADKAAEAKGDDHGNRRDIDRPLIQIAHNVGASHTEDNAEDASHRGEHRCLREELEQNSNGRSADRHAQADFTCTLCD